MAKTLQTRRTYSLIRSTDGCRSVVGDTKVSDPSFDTRPTSELLKEFGWMRERVLQIRLALLRDGRRLVPLSEYLDLCKAVDRGSH